MITRAQFALVRPALESLRKATRPRTHDLFDVFVAIVHLLENDTPWRLLPGPIPWRTVNEYFAMWTNGDHLADSLAALGMHEALIKLGARFESNKKYFRERKAA